MHAPFSSSRRYRQPAVVPSRSGNRAAHGDNMIREPFTAVEVTRWLPLSPRDTQEIRTAEFMSSFSQGTGGTPCRPKALTSPFHYC